MENYHQFSCIPSALDVNNCNKHALLADTTKMVNFNIPVVSPEALQPDSSQSCLSLPKFRTKIRISLPLNINHGSYFYLSTQLKRGSIWKFMPLFQTQAIIFRYLNNYVKKSVAYCIQLCVNPF